MSSKNFDQLASTLSDSEKKSLLNQISENITSSPIMEDEKYASFIEKENRDFKIKSLKKDIEELGFFHKILLNIKSFITGKDILEVHNNDLLAGLERRLSYSAPTLVSTKKRRFTSILINDFLKINSLVLPFIEYFSLIWESPIALERLIGAIIGEKYNSVKSNLDDFLRESEIDRMISEGADLEEVKKRVLKAMYDYRKKIPDHIFPETEEELLSLISLKNIVLYNFNPIFKLMGISIGDSYSDVSEKSVSMSLVVKYLEEFYKLLIHFTGVSLHKSSVDALISLAIEDDENYSEVEEQIWKNYNSLSEKLKSIIVEYPFEDLIKFSRSNPFYKMDFTIQKINVADFYFSALKKEVLAELSSKFSLREKAVVDTMIVEFFKSFDFVKLNNYTIHKDFDYNALGLSYFKYIESAEILFNFIKHYYLREYKDIVFVLSKHIFEKNHLLQTRSLELSIGVETLLERLLRFDRSLASDSEAGKTMRTLFGQVAANRQNVRMYKAFIKQKDLDILELLKLGAKLFQDLEKILIQTVKSPSDTVKLQVSAIHPSISRKITLREVLMAKIDEIKKFQDVYNKKIIFDSQS